VQVCAHDNEIDQQGLAQGYGFCATQHFEQVMGKIGMVMKNDLVQKSTGGFFGFGGGTTGDHPKAALMRSSLLLCFGWITVYSSGDCSLVADQVIRPMLSMIPDLSNLHLRLCALRAIDIMGKALNGAQGKHQFVIDTRDELLDVVVNEISTFPQPGRGVLESSQELRLTGIQACTRLVILDPTISESQSGMILSHVAPFYDLVSDSTGSLLSGICNLMAAMLHKQCTTGLLHIVLDSLLTRASGPENIPRARVCSTASFLLKSFVESVAGGKTSLVELEPGLEQSGFWCGVFVPRLLDPVEKVRSHAIETIDFLLHLDAQLRARSESGATPVVAPEAGPVALLGGWNRLEEGCYGEEEVAALTASLESAGEVIAAGLHATALQGYLRHLIQALSDWDAQGSLAAACMLRTVLCRRGQEMEEDVPWILSDTLTALDALDNELVERITPFCLEGLAILAATHLHDAAVCLLKEPLPVRGVVELWLMALLEQGPQAVESTMDTLLLAAHPFKSPGVFKPELEPTSDEEALPPIQPADGEDKEAIKAAHAAMAAEAEAERDAAIAAAAAAERRQSAVATALLKRCLANTPLIEAYLTPHRAWVLHVLVFRLGAAREAQEGGGELSDAFETLCLLLGGFDSPDLNECAESKAEELTAGAFPAAIADLAASVCDAGGAATLLDWAGFLAADLLELGEASKEDEEAAVAATSQEQPSGAEGEAEPLLEPPRAEEAPAGMEPPRGRVTCISAAGPLLHRCCDQKLVCGSLLGSLLDAAGSRDDAVRKASYRALRACMLLRKENMEEFTSRLVDAFFKGLSDPCAEVASDSSCILLHILEQDCLDQAAVAKAVPLGSLLQTALEMSRRADLRGDGLRMFTSLCHTAKATKDPDVTVQLKEMLIPVAVYRADPSCQGACTAAIRALSSILEFRALEKSLLEEDGMENEAFFEQIGAVAAANKALSEGCLETCGILLTEGDGPTRVGAIGIGAAVVAKLRASPGGEKAGEAMLAAVVGALADGDRGVRQGAARALVALQPLVPP